MITLETLKDQLAILKEDYIKQRERLCEINGSIKIVEHLMKISEENHG